MAKISLLFMGARLSLKLFPDYDNYKHAKKFQISTFPQRLNRKTKYMISTKLSTFNYINNMCHYAPIKYD